MKTRAVRLYGKNDFRLEEFDLPEIKDNEILAKIISDSLCLSSYKAAIQGADHKRVPNDVAEKPIIIGHEFSGVIEKVGSKWADKFQVGQKFAIHLLLTYLALWVSGCGCLVVGVWLWGGVPNGSDRASCANI